MLLRTTTFLTGLLGAALVAHDDTVRAAEPSEDQVEVLARGPVHEGYAEPIDPKPVAGPIVSKQPPEPIDELPPDQKPEGDNVIWLPGYWSWDQDREDFIWVSGFWRVSPPRRVWVPGSWRKLDNGWQWVGGFWNSQQQQQAEIEYVPEPPASLDEGPATPAPSETAIYVPGTWVWRTRYVWRPGVWIDYRPGWIWIPAHYRWTPCGYVFVDGYWDYPLAGRGILFAPVYIPRRIYVAPSYYYTPTVVVRDECMYGALFVRRGWGCYYFGDYFGPTYASVGYTSWCGYAGGREVVVVRGWYDPMYSYYRVSYRDDPYWRGGITQLYVGRFRGDIPPPPRTLVQQNTIIRNTTIVNNNIVVNNKSVNVNHVAMLSSINTAAKAKNLPMQTLSAEARQDQLRSTRQFHAVAQQRSQLETQMIAKQSASPSAAAAPRTLKLDVSKTSFQPAVTGTSPSRTAVSDPKLQVNPNPPAAATKSPATVTSPVVPRHDGTSQPSNLGKYDPKSVVIPSRNVPLTSGPRLQPPPNLNNPLGAKPSFNGNAQPSSTFGQALPLGSSTSGQRTDPKSIGIPSRNDPKSPLSSIGPVHSPPSPSPQPGQGTLTQPGLGTHPGLPHLGPTGVVPQHQLPAERSSPTRSEKKKKKD